MKFLYILVLMGATLSLSGCAFVKHVVSHVTGSTAGTPVTLDKKPRFDAEVSYVKFNFDKYELKDGNPIVGDAATLLDKFISKANVKYGKGSYKVGVAGRTDYVGSEEYNDGLGMRRAKSVAAYLESKGIEVFLVYSSGETDDVVTEPYLAQNVPGIGTRETNRSITLIVHH